VLGAYIYFVWPLAKRYTSRTISLLFPRNLKCAQYISLTICIARFFSMFAGELVSDRVADRYLAHKKVTKFREAAAGG